MTSMPASGIIADALNGENSCKGLVVGGEEEEEDDDDDDDEQERRRTQVKMGVAYVPTPFPI